MAKTDVIRELRSLDKVGFFSTATCQEDCAAAGQGLLIEGSYKKVGVPCVVDGKTVMVVVDSKGGVKTVDISALDASSVLDNVRQGDIFENVDRFMTTMSTQLTSQGVRESLTYSIRMQDTGTRFSTSITESAVLVAAFSKLVPTYFDLCTRINSSNLVYYSSRTSGSLTHSGDVVNAGELLHTVKVSRTTAGTVIVPFLTGYRNTPLKKFEEHRPVVMIWDHETKECFVIRVPLDPITLGNSTLCAPIVGKVGTDGRVYWEVLPNPCVGSGSAPSFDSESNKSLERARACGANLTESPAGSFEKITTAFANIFSKKQEQHKDPTTPVHMVEEAKHKLVILHTEDVDPSFTGITPDVHVRFGTSVYFADAEHRYHSTYHTAEGRLPAAEKDPVLLPCVVPGGLSGGLLLTAGRVNKTMRQGVDLKAFYDTTSLLVAVVSDRMLDSAREASPNMRLNGLYIVVPSSPPARSVLEDKTRVREYLMGLNINAAMALAGPLSLIVAGLRDEATGEYRYFALDGAGMPMLLLPPVTPFEEVTREFSDLKSWARDYMAAGDAVSRAVLVDRRDREVVYNGTPYKVEALADLFAVLDVEEFAESKAAIKEVLAQLRMLLDDSELKKMGNKLVLVLRQKMVPAWVLTDEERGSLDEMLAGNMKLSTSYKAHKTKVNETKKALQWLVEELGCMVSASRTGTIGFNIKRLEKVQKVAANVGAALNMSLKDFNDLTEEHCSIAGAVVCTANKEAMKELLQTVADNTFRKFATDKWEELMARNPLSWDKPLFDANAVGCLLELTKDARNHPLAQKAGCTAQTLAMPNSHAEDSVSALALFLMDKFVEMKDPFVAKWYAYADWRPVAVVRVLLRGTVADASLCREVHPAIAPTNYDLGLFLATVVLAQIRQIAERRSPDAPVDFDDTITQIVRGLYGFVLTLLASTGTGQPISTAWQLVSESIQVPQLPQDHDWVYYGELVRNFKATGWDTKQLHRNIAWLLVHWTNLKVAQPLCNALRGATKGGKDLVTGLRVERKTFSYVVTDDERADVAPTHTYGMPHITVAMLGSAGAGKSTLVERLTEKKLPGTSAAGDPEKTVDGGYYDMPSKALKGMHATLVDVPGDRFRSKNFLSHASHGDYGILVVSADMAEAELRRKTSDTPEGKSRSHCNNWLVFGRKHLIVAVSKMDKVGHSQARYEEVVAMVREVVKKSVTVVFVPVDRDGENIYTKSAKMPWYEGESLVGVLNGLEEPIRHRNKHMEMTIARRYRIRKVGDVVVGKVVQGVLAPGDAITFLGAACGPIESKVISLQTHPGKQNVARAEAGDLIGICFKVEDRARLPKGGCVAVSGGCCKECVAEHTATVQVTGKGLKVGSNMQVYTGTTRDTVCIKKIERLVGTAHEEVDRMTSGVGKVTFTAKWKGVALSTAAGNPLSRLIFMDGPNEVMVGRADATDIVLDESAAAELAKMEARANKLKVAAGGVMRLPKCLEGNPVGLAVQNLLGRAGALSKFAESNGVLNQEQMDRATTALAECRPPPASVMQVLCNEARLPITETHFADMIDEMVMDEGSAAVEMTILKRLGF